MKKVLVLFLVLTCMLSLAACDKATGSREPVAEGEGAVSDMPNDLHTESIESESTQKAETEQDTSKESELNVEMVKQAEEFAKAYYDDTVFEVVSIELQEQSENEVVFTVCASKDGVIQEPNRTIWLHFNNENWEVTNEGF